MKKAVYKVGISFALIVSGLFVTPVYAFDISTTVTGAPYACFEGGSMQNPCTSSGDWNDNTYVQQEFTISFTTEGAYTIDTASIYVEHDGGVVGADTTFIAYILNTDEDVLATSNSRVGITYADGWLDFTFPTPYSWSDASPDQSIPHYLKVSKTCSGDCGTQKIRPLFTETYAFGLPGIGSWSTTTPGSFPALFSGNINGGDQDPEQLMFKLSTSDYYPFTIDSPVPNSRYDSGTNLVFSGQCGVDSVELFLSNGGAFSQYTDFDIYPILCSGHAYSYTIGQLATGTWDLVGSTTDGYKSFQFDYGSTTELWTATPWTEATSTAGFWNWVGDNTKTFVKYTRPYSYVFDIVFGLFNAMDHASATAWLEGVEFSTTNGTQTIAFIDSHTFDDAPSGATTVFGTLRGFSTIVIYLSFVWYVWALRKRFV